MNTRTVFDQLHKKNIRLTPVRKKIADYFSTQSSPVTAKQLCRFFSFIEKPVHKTTIYRQLQFFVKEGLITEQLLFREARAYEWTQSKHYHHITCDLCGKIQKIDECNAKNIEKSIFQKSGFLINRHVFEFFGICRTCKKTLTKKEGL